MAEVNNKYIFQAWSNAKDASVYWNKMVNDKILEINKQLLAIAAVIIPLIIAVLAIPGIHLPGEAKMSLYLAIVFLSVSIICGFIDMITGYHFFRSYQKWESEKAKIYNHNILKTEEKDITKIEDEIEDLELPEKSTGTLFIIFQGLFLSIAVVLMSGVTIFVIASK